MTRPIPFRLLPIVLATSLPTCAPAVRPTLPASPIQVAELWQPADVAAADAFYGPWGRAHAPDPRATYTLVARKHKDTNPGVTVVDREGRKWHVKQAPDNDQGAEGPIEVVLSRVLSAVGYHQPPVYFLPSFTMADSAGTHTEPGGRFRLDEASLKELGPWSWQQNPFVGTDAYQGLLVILMMLNSSDLKNDNNSLYEVKGSLGGLDHWYVVRDLGTALGETGRLAPVRGDVDVFERSPFIAGVNGPFVNFNYHGWHQELVRDRIRRQDLSWASRLLGQLSDRQWGDAFQAGGFDAAVAARFIRRIHDKVSEGQRLGSERP